jgi:hypothetical protein
VSTLSADVLDYLEHIHTGVMVTDLATRRAASTA